MLLLASLSEDGERYINLSKGSMVNGVESFIDNEWVDYTSLN